MSPLLSWWSKWKANEDNKYEKAAGKESADAKKLSHRMPPSKMLTVCPSRQASFIRTIYIYSSDFALCFLIIEWVCQPIYPMASQWHSSWRAITVCDTFYIHFCNYMYHLFFFSYFILIYSNNYVNKQLVLAWVWKWK